MSVNDERGTRPFYVGYLPIPRAHAVFLMIALPLTLAAMAVGALGLSSSQLEWGDGFWQTGEASEWEGTLALEPYPMLHTVGVGGDEGDGEGGETVTYLLVEMGKFGAQDRFGSGDGAAGGLADGLDGARVVIRGRELHRDGRRMIELDPDHPELGPPWRVVEGDGPAVRAPLVRGDESVELVGEIVDSKCFLGAMKPGAGRGHKACATLCIEGGIPPVLVSVGRDGSAVYHLLTDAEGGALDNSDVPGFVPLIGERVSLSGRAGSVGSWRVLMVEGLSAGVDGVPSRSP